LRSIYLSDPFSLHTKIQIDALSAFTQSTKWTIINAASAKNTVIESVPVKPLINHFSQTFKTSTPYGLATHANLVPFVFNL
jgi:hypothetical protein